MSHLDDQFLQSGAVHILRVVVDDLPPRRLPEAAHDHHDRGGGGRDHLPPAHRVLVSLLQKEHSYTFSISSISILSATQKLLLIVKNVITTLQTKAVTHCTQNQCFWVYHLSVQNVITNIQTKAAWQHIKSMLMCLTFLCNKCVRQFTGKITH